MAKEIELVGGPADGYRETVEDHMTWFEAEMELDSVAKLRAHLYRETDRTTKEGRSVFDYYGPKEVDKKRRRKS